VRPCPCVAAGRGGWWRARRIGAGRLPRLPRSALLTRNFVPGLPVALPQAHQFTVVFLIGVAATLFAALLVAAGLREGRRGPRGTRDAADGAVHAAPQDEVASSRPDRVG
jgi:hypothetical protein